MVTCQYCGHEATQPDATYCSYCGSSLNQAGPTGAPAVAQAPASRSMPSQGGAALTDVAARYEKALKRLEQQVTIVLVLAVVTVVLVLVV